MRSLALLPKCPVPPDNGGRQRLVELLSALHERGPLDVVIAQPISTHERDEILATFPGGRIHAPGAPVATHPRGRLRWLTERHLPLGVGLLDPRQVQSDAGSFVNAAPTPDLVFAAGARARWIFRPVAPDAPVVIDFADITGVLERRERDVLRQARPWRSPTMAKDLVRHSVDAARWATFEREQAATASLVTVCSPADRDALGAPHAAVVPNGAHRPPTPAATRRSEEPTATLLFPGQMTYGPNVDGARWFVEEVLPKLRRVRPDAHIRIVGRAAPEVEALGSVAGVTITGYVDHMDEALAAATAVVVPLRQGSGTRIKILEAWANHLPVVSTTVGAEGLAITDGDDALLADDADAFAAACARVLDDRALRQRLVAHGTKRFEQDFDWRAIRASFGDRVDAVVAAGVRADR